MNLINGGIEKVKGIKTYTAAAGLKESGKKDLAIVYSEKIADAAGVFTKNKIKAAPLIVSMSHLKDGKAQAIVINSGCANAGTGNKGIEDAETTCEIAAKELGIKKENVLAASTGVIGQFLPMDKIKDGIKNAKNKLSSGSIAEAIFTTDLAKKEIAVEIGGVTIGATAKGSGMMAPNMATMLCFIAADAEFSAKDLKSMLKESVDKSFNMVSVDMDTSTNDSVFLLANGIAGKIDKTKFQSALDYVCIELAKKIAADGEGATKLIEVNVEGAKTDEDAKKIAKSIISSNLVKAAAFGNDPNFGRVLCAIGNSNADFDESNIDIYFQNKLIVKGGMKTNFKKQEVSSLMQKEKFNILVDLNSGNSKAAAWGCDLTYDYVKINAEYHT